MKIKSILRLSFTNLLRRKLRSFLTIIAVSVAIGVLFFLINTAESIKGQITTTIYRLQDATNIVFNEKSNFLGFSSPTSQTVATSSVKTKKITDKTIAEIKKIDHVRSAYPQIWVDPSVVEVTLTNRKQATSSAVTVNPIFVEEKKQFEQRNRFKNNFITKGNFFESNEKDALIAPATLAKILKLKVGDSVEFKIDQISLNPDPEKPPLPKKTLAKLDVKVIALAKEPPVLPYEFRDHPLGFISYSLAKKIFDISPINGTIPKEVRPNKGEYFSGTLYVDEITNVRNVQREVVAKGYDAFTIFDGIDAINQFFLIIQGILTAFSLVGVLIALIGISNTMFMSTLERTKEIGVLKALGAKDRDIYRIFLFESASFGFIGGLIGVGFASLIGFAVAFIGNVYLQSKLNQIVENGTGVSDVSVTYTIDFKILLIVMLFSIILAIIAGFLPARKASKLDPIKALKYE